MFKANQPMKIILTVALVAAILAGSALIGGEVTQAGTGAIDRLGGADRYATSALIAGEQFSSSSYCIVTRGDVYADGLAASTLAGALDCPVLLTRSDELPATVSSRIKNLGYPKVIILGGTSAVSTKVENALKSLVGSTKVERIGGSDRFDTAARIARRAKQEYYLPGYAFIVNGWASADSLVAGPAAFENRAPILQVEKNTIPEVTKKAISDLGVTRLIIVGGTAVVSDSVKTALEKLPSVYSVTRLAGATRYETAVEFAKSQFSGVGNFSLVRGADANLADAIGATVLGFPILYVERDNIPSAVNNYLDSEVTSLSDMFVIGGTSAISDGVYTDARAKITGDDTCKFSKSSLYLDGSAENTLTISGTTFKNITFYKDDHYTISGLPSGVTSKLERTGSYTAKLTLTGSPGLTSNQTVTVRILAAAVNSGRNLPSASFTLTKTAEEVVVGELTLSNLNPPAVTVNGDYGLNKFRFQASGGKAPYTFTALTVGTYLLPTTKSFNESDTEFRLISDGEHAGKILGTPTTAGTYKFVLEVKDSGVGKDQKTATALITIDVNAKPSIAVDHDGDNPPDATRGRPYNYALKVTDGTPRFTFVKVEPADPLSDGFKWTDSGVISNNKVPDGAKDLGFTIKIIDKYGVYAESPLRKITINNPPKFNDSLKDTSGNYELNLDAGNIGEISLITNLLTDKGTGPYTFSYTGTLPPDLELVLEDGEPTLKGVLRQSGTFTLTITDRWGASATGKIKIIMK